MMNAQRALIVSDDKALHALLAPALEREGYAADLCDAGVSCAIAMLQGHRH